ncbi:hypothetical protein OAK24_02460 [Flavobacteriales bacterium]|nr:hypothetical protein [Flavobacteriales bacterium]
MKETIVRIGLLFILCLKGFTVSSQEYVHQVLILNEGYFDYSVNQSVIPPTIGSYNPLLEIYTNVDTLYSARFASDLVVDEDYFYVAADNMLYKYDKNSYNIIASQQIDGIRNLAVWNDKIIVTRGDYDNATFSPILFNSYLQIYNASDLSFYSEIDTITGPRWATQNLVISDTKLYVAINNAYEWGNEKGFVGILDLNTFTYINEIDLGIDGVNPDNMIKSGDCIYTINNKDWLGSSISQLNLLTNSVLTTNLASAPTGCGTSCLRNGKINYQISGDSILNEWDISLLSNTGTPLPINQSFYDLSHDPISNLLYTSITDYITSGSINIYDYNNSLVSSFVCGISPGTIVFDVRSMATGIHSISSDSYDHPSSQSYDMLGRVISDTQFMKEGMYIKGNTKYYIAK